MDPSVTQLIMSAAAVGGLFYLFQTFTIRWKVADNYADYRNTPVYRRYPRRHAVDMQPNDQTIDQTFYEAYQEDQFFDSTSRIIDTENDLAMYRGRNEYSRLDVTTL